MYKFDERLSELRSALASYDPRRVTRLLIAARAHKEPKFPELVAYAEASDPDALSTRRVYEARLPGRSTEAFRCPSELTRALLVYHDRLQYREGRLFPRAWEQRCPDDILDLFEPSAYPLPPQTTTRDQPVVSNMLAEARLDAHWAEYRASLEYMRYLRAGLSRAVRFPLAVLFGEGDPTVNQTRSDT